MTARRMSADEVRKDVVDGRALLLSAYPRARYDSWHLDGAIPLEDFKSSAPTMDKSRKVVFYCA